MDFIVILFIVAYTLSSEASYFADQYGVYEIRTSLYNKSEKVMTQVHIILCVGVSLCVCYIGSATSCDIVVW